MRKRRFTEGQMVGMLREADKTSVTEKREEARRERADAVHVAQERR